MYKFVLRCIGADEIIRGDEKEGKLSKLTVSEVPFDLGYYNRRRRGGPRDRPGV